MSATQAESSRRKNLIWAAITIGILIVIAGVTIYSPWSSNIQTWFAQQVKKSDGGHGHDHGSHGGGQAEANSITLSKQARKTIGLKLAPVKLETFQKKITIPAQVVHRPGHSEIAITAPLTGIVTKINVVEGQSIKPGQLLFQLRLTHEDLVTTQGEFLQTIEALDVEEKELKRLNQLSEGLIAGKTILEHEYQQLKLKGRLKSQRQQLLLHGLSHEQIEQIEKTRNLLSGLSVYAPTLEEIGEHALDHQLHIEEIAVKVGQQAVAGEPLCVLGDHCDLLIEGMAFEEDANILHDLAKSGQTLTVRDPNSNTTDSTIPDLKIYYVSNQIKKETRTLKFFLELPNTIISTAETKDSLKFISWRFKPGQRLEIQLPAEKFENRIVLPNQAVVEDGAENYVFIQNGDHFDRVKVQVEYRDQLNVIIANDGSVFPGDQLVIAGAYQLHLAIKNAAGGGIDPHAGHNH